MAKTRCRKCGYTEDDGRPHDRAVYPSLCTTCAPPPATVSTSDTATCYTGSGYVCLTRDGEKTLCGRTVTDIPVAPRVALPVTCVTCLTTATADDHSASRRVDVLEREAPHLIARALYRPIINPENGIEWTPAPDTGARLGAALVELPAPWIRLEPTEQEGRYRAPDGSTWFGCTDNIWRCDHA